MKKLTAVYIFLILLLITNITPLASRDERIQSENLLSNISSTLSTKKYNIYDKNGNDITLDFSKDTLNDTQLLIKEMEAGNIGSIVLDKSITQESVSSSVTSATIIKQVWQLIEWDGELEPHYKGINKQNNNGIITFEVEASYTFDNDTKEILSVDEPYIVHSSLEKQDGTQKWNARVYPEITYEAVEIDDDYGTQANCDYKYTVEGLYFIGGDMKNGAYMSTLSYGSYNIKLLLGE